jgi:hypothetical protein
MEVRMVKKDATRLDPEALQKECDRLRHKVSELRADLLNAELAADRANEQADSYKDQVQDWEDLAFIPFKRVEERLSELGFTDLEGLLNFGAEKQASSDCTNFSDWLHLLDAQIEYNNLSPEAIRKILWERRRELLRLGA